MFLYFILFIFFGCFAGVITGLVPGIHINLISILVLSSAPFLAAKISLFYLTIFIISMAITHTFLDSLPSIYLGAPDESQALIVLPGHKFLMRGDGHNAVKLTLIGSFLSLILAVILSPLLAHFILISYPIIRNKIGYILIIVAVYMILRTRNKFSSFLMFFASGVLGLITLNSSIKQPLFPLLSGLFGLSILLISLMQKVKIPKQEVKPLRLKKSEVTKASFVAVIVGFFASFLPGLGNSQAVIIGQQFFRKTNDKIFLIMVGGINTVNFALSLITFYLLAKARNGAVVVIKKIVDSITLDQLFIYLIVTLVTASIALAIGINLSKQFIRLITKVDYNKLIIGVIVLIIILTFILSGPIGFLLLVTSTSLGLVSTQLGVGKNNLMGCLIIPVILFFVL